MRNWTALPRFSVLVGGILNSFSNGCWQAKRVRPVGKLLWVSTGGRCGYVVKLGVLRACPHIHADPLLIHQVARCWPSRSGFLVFGKTPSPLHWPFLHICQRSTRHHHWRWRTPHRAFCTAVTGAAARCCTARSIRSGQAATRPSWHSP